MSGTGILVEQASCLYPPSGGCPDSRFPIPDSLGARLPKLEFVEVH
ncbi:MAG: hypothetical protein F6K65_10450 [Moorea sp. SIO3C2]|nr:hypothetical protein [Moorena sp. SIO3C2]